ncbi:hypothetical protein TcWFU_006276 [Taenia crassiceps]|uniref:Uncharacterized protein n=1 Tax=Taenia crassiceps TaxID=6207 RepID=A0ABR4Q9J2_9CEST
MLIMRPSSGSDSLRGSAIVEVLVPPPHEPEAEEQVPEPTLLMAFGGGAPANASDTSHEPPVNSDHVSGPQSLYSFYPGIVSSGKNSWRCAHFMLTVEDAVVDVDNRQHGEIAPSQTDLAAASTTPRLNNPAVATEPWLFSFPTASNHVGRIGTVLRLLLLPVRNVGRKVFQLPEVMGIRVYYASLGHCLQKCGLVYIQLKKVFLESPITCGSPWDNTP